MAALAIGIDMGATHIKGVLIDASGRLLHQTQTDTNEKIESFWKSGIATTLNDLQTKAGEKISCLGLSAPGLASAANDCIACMPGRLEGLEHFDWSEFLGMKTHVLNDAHAATLAEAKFGAGKDRKNIILLTLGSGVGGGIVINGELYQSLLQRAGHLGHNTVNAESEYLDVTGMPGSLEDAIGNISVEKRAYGKFKSTRLLVEAYQQGDTLATYVWLKSVKILAAAISSYINILSPELVIVGGGIAAAGKALFEPLSTFMEVFEWRNSGISVPVVPAALGEHAGAIGAAAFALQRNGDIK